MYCCDCKVNYLKRAQRDSASLMLICFFFLRMQSVSCPGQAPLRPSWPSMRRAPTVRTKQPTLHTFVHYTSLCIQDSMINALALEWLGWHSWDCFCCFGNAIHVNTSSTGTSQCFSVIHYSRSADDLLGKVCYGRCFCQTYWIVILIVL